MITLSVALSLMTAYTLWLSYKFDRLEVFATEARLLLEDFVEALEER